MISESLAAFMEGAVMIVLSVADTQGRPTIAKGLGAHYDANADEIVILTSRHQWPMAVEAISAGVPIAVTFCRAADYTTYQVKGRVTAIAEPEEPDLTLCQHYAALTGRTLGGLGVSQALIDQWVLMEDVVRVDFKPATVFVQTPGPSAGRALEAAK